MFIVTIGPLSLNGPLLLYIAYGAAGLAAVRLATRDTAEPLASRIRSAAFTAFAIWLAVWKGSFAVFDPRLAWEEPTAWLYFDGGAAGRWLATASAVGWTVRAALRSGVASLGRFAYAASAFLTFGYAAYRFGHVLFGRASVSDVGLWAAVAASALLYLVPLRKQPGFGRAALQSLVLFGAALLLLHAFDGREADAGSVRRGDSAPNATLAGIDGRALPIPAASPGGIVALNFWATWCPPCRAEMASLEGLHRTLDGEEAKLIAVNLTATESASDAAERFARERGLTLPIALDPDGAVMRAYGIRAYPTTVLIDGDGKVVEVFEGAVHANALERAIRDVRDRSSRSDAEE